MRSCWRGVDIASCRETLQLRSSNLSGAGALGGLSGSTYPEAVSWGKFVPPEEGGRFAEVFDDATVALPLIVRAGWSGSAITSTKIASRCGRWRA